jgi:hypothetical protein
MSEMQRGFPLQKTIWAAAATGANTTSTAFLDAGLCPFVSVIGTVSGATTITAMLSIDGVTFYAGPTQVLAGSGGFTFNFTTGAQYIALQSTNNVTATAIATAK